MIRLGFLGAGWIGLQRMQAIAESGAAEVAAVADSSPVARELAKERAPGARLGEDLESLLRLGLDGIVIATPSALHADQAIQALQQGAAVFCQKPLARSAPECRMVIEAARAADRLLGVDLSYRFVAGVDVMRALIQGGELGTIYAVQLAFHNAYGPDKAWFLDPRLAGGGCVIDLGIHLVDLALWILGFPDVRRVESVLTAQGRRWRGRLHEVEDHAAALLETSDGASIQLACSWRLPAGQDCAIEASFFGTRGGVTLRNVGGSFYDFTVERHSGTRRETLTRPPDAWGGRAAVDWAQRLAAGARFDPEVERAATVADVLDRIYSE